MYAERLSDAQRATADLTPMEAQIADTDGQIKAAKERLIGLKAQLLRDDEAVQKLLNMVVISGK